MVRWIWANSLTTGVLRALQFLLKWVRYWVARMLRRTMIGLGVSRHIFSLLVSPRDPNNLFLSGVDATQNAAEQNMADTPLPDEGLRKPNLLWAVPRTLLAGEAALPTQALSLWRGAERATADAAVLGITATNRRFTYADILGTQIKRLSTKDMHELESLIRRLARKWLDHEQKFEWIPRRNHLDVLRTLRYNVPRYAGHILDFKWADKERPIAALAKPARLLVIGDVSHSMVHYVSVVLYYFHLLNFRFVVDSYVFSENATHATPYLNGPGTFSEKVKRLVSGARSWNAGTRLGSALAEISTTARVDKNTHVIIATDGKVSLEAQEADQMERYMHELRGRAQQVIFLTPSSDFSNGAHGKSKVERIGSFKFGFDEIPIFNMGPPLWYGTLARHADRLYLVKTVQDLVSMTEDLLEAAKN